MDTNTVPVPHSKSKKLTLKQLKFAEHVAAGKTHAESYRLVYNVENMKPESIWRKAHELSVNGKVTAKIDELRQPAMISFRYSVEQHMQELFDAAAAATEAGHHSAAVRAIELLGKVSGYYVDRSQVQVAHLVVLDD